jgi:hypothetical protein
MEPTRMFSHTAAGVICNGESQEQKGYYRRWKPCNNFNVTSMRLCYNPPKHQPRQHVVGVPEYKSWSSTQSFQEEKLHLQNIKYEWLISNFLKYVTHQCHEFLSLYTSGNRWMNEYGALVELSW